MNITATLRVMVVIMGVILVPLHVHCDGNGGTGKSRKLPLTEKKEFVELFKVKRAAQLQAVKSILGMDKYETRHKMVIAVFNKLFEVQQNARAVVENSAYIPGGDESSSSLPNDQPTLEALSSIIENCALLGDIVLRLPEISGNVLKGNQQWMINTQWCISFTNATGLIDEVTDKMFNLVAQELDLIPREEAFHNPYRTSADPFSDIPSKAKPVQSKQEQPVRVQKKTTEKKKTIKKGPRLSRVEL